MINLSLKEHDDFKNDSSDKKEHMILEEFKIIQMEHDPKARTCARLTVIFFQDKMKKNIKCLRLKYCTQIIAQCVLHALNKNHIIIGTKK